MVGSNSNSSNMYELMDANINSYRSIVIDEMRMNQDYLDESSRNILYIKN
jgi:hypothetical protein